MPGTGTSASSAVRDAAHAQARALNAARTGGEGTPTAAAAESSGGRSGGGSASGGSGDGSPAGGGNVLPNVNVPPGPDWGRLRTQIAHDLLQGRHENVSGEYRDRVEAYFRTIAQKATGQTERK